MRRLACEGFLERLAERVKRVRTAFLKVLPEPGLKHHFSKRYLTFLT
jgi:hypothetical protein